MSRDDPHFRLRIRAGILARLQRAAEISGRSVTSEINKRLEASLDANEQIEPLASMAPPVEPGRVEIILDEFHRRIAEIEARLPAVDTETGALVARKAKEMNANVADSETATLARAISSAALSMLCWQVYASTISSNGRRATVRHSVPCVSSISLAIRATTTNPASIASPPKARSSSRK